MPHFLRTPIILSMAAMLLPLSACAREAYKPAERPNDAPTAFLERLYQPYERGNPDKAPAPSQRYTADVAALIERDRKESEGELGRLDYDPICNCQDFDALRDVHIVVSGATAEAATARVSFRNGTENQTLDYRLQREGTAWHIADICPTDGTCLKAVLSAP